MKKVCYNVAGHLFSIVFKDADNDERLIPSFAPFMVSEVGEQLFELIVDDSFHFDEPGTEIGQFDCGGCNHGVYRTAQGNYQFVVSDTEEKKCCYMSSDAHFTKITVSLLANTWRQRNFGLNNALMMAYAFSAATSGTLLIHASVVRNNEKGYLFLGKSGTGKSTHTKLWLQYIEGTDLMNDDNPVVRITDGQVNVYGSPWSGKTPCYRNIVAPVGAFTRISQCPENKIRRESPIQAFASLLPTVSNMKWDKRVYSGVCDTISAILPLVPVYLLDCLPDEAAARLSSTTLIN